MSDQLLRSPEDVARACATRALASLKTEPVRTMALDNAIIEQTRVMFFDIAPLRHHIADTINNHDCFAKLIELAQTADMILAEKAESHSFKSENAYSFATRFRESMGKPRYGSILAIETALTEDLNTAMIAHIRKNPILFRTGFLIQSVLNAYFSRLNQVFYLALPEKKTASLIRLLLDESEKISGVANRTFVEEFLPFLAMAHQDVGDKPDVVGRDGLLKAYRCHAFRIENHTFKTENDVKKTRRCPFATNMAHLMATDLRRDNNGRCTIAPEPRPGALFEFFYRELEKQPALPKPAPEFS